MRRAARTDANHKSVSDAFKALGCDVVSLAAVGNGVPDLLIGIHGVNGLVEVKDGSKPPSEQKLTPDQEKFHANWRGRIFVCRSIVEVPNIVAKL